MAKQSINYANVDSNKKDLQVIFNHINQIFDNTETACSSIVSSEIWNGKAADYYVAKAKAVFDNFEDIDYELKAIINYLETVMNNYQNFEKGIVNSISN